MERHHQMRRDPNWSPHGCNLCGNEGHQAAQCDSGTVDWIDRFGIDAFLPKKPYYDIKPRSPPDYDSIEKAARLYAETKEKATSVDTKVVGEKLQQELLKHAQRQLKAQQQQPQQQQGGEGLPPGWKSYTAPNGKKYYHHAATNKTQWKKPEVT